MDDRDVLVELENSESLTQRLTLFARTVIPADPWQPVYLVGIVFLLISGALPMRPDELAFSSSFRGRSPFDLNALLPYIVLFGLVSLLASFVAFATCFWPGPNPALRISCAVILPTLAVQTLLVWKVFKNLETYSSLFHAPSALQFVHWARINAARFPTSFYFGACALILIGSFTVGLGGRVTSLPISVLPLGNASAEENRRWPRMELFLLLFFGPLIAVSGIVGLSLMTVESWMFSRVPTQAILRWNVRVSPVVDAALFLALSLFVLGREGIRQATRSLCLPGVRWGLLGILLPFGIGVLATTADWAIDRVQWAQHSMGLYAPPAFASYFHLSDWQPWLLLMILGAFAEEIVFRGVVLAAFIKRYGMQRGVFLTGIAWAMIHFRSDRYSGLSAGGVLLHLIWRILICLAELCFCLDDLAFEVGDPLWSSAFGFKYPGCVWIGSQH